MFGIIFMMLVFGYILFMDGGWSVMWFFFDYGMIGFFIVVFFFWKIFCKSIYVRLGNVDISFGGFKEEIDNYEFFYVL